MISEATNSDLVPFGTIVKERWRITRKIGGGGFGEVYEAIDINSRAKVAIKVESNTKAKQVLKMEVAVLKKLQDCEYICRLHGCGRHQRFNYLVMSLQGKNLSEIRKSFTSGTFSLGTTFRILLQVLDAIQAVHDVGFIHRDIKPSNFAIGSTLETIRNIYILDFGLARFYLNSSDEIRQPRRSAGFRGTVRYASYRAHLSQELCRADDLWSTIYMTIECITGALPWRKMKDKEQVGKMKIKMNSIALVRCLPFEFQEFYVHVNSLSYFDRPDYAYLKSIIQQILTRFDISENSPFDWEVSEDPLESSWSSTEQNSDDHLLQRESHFTERKHRSRSQHMVNDRTSRQLSNVKRSCWKNIFSFGSKGSTAGQEEGVEKSKESLNIRNSSKARKYKIV